VVKPGGEVVSSAGSATGFSKLETMTVPFPTLPPVCRMALVSRRG
jgi:hypothetical protein